VVRLDLRGPLREQITRLNSVANPTPPAISSPSIPIAFSLARIWSPNPCNGLHSRFLATEDRYIVSMASSSMKRQPIATPAPFLHAQFLYYETLTNYVREKAGAWISVLNSGTYSPSDCWMGITNIR
jgi:hypothetical protein